MTVSGLIYVDSLPAPIFCLETFITTVAAPVERDSDLVYITWILHLSAITKQHFYDFVATQRSLDFFSSCSNEEISCLKWLGYSTSSLYSVWIQMRSCWIFQWQASAPRGISKAANAGCSEAHNVVSMWQELRLCKLPWELQMVLLLMMLWQTTMFLPSPKLLFLKLRILTGAFVVGAEVGASPLDRTSTLSPTSEATKAAIASTEVGQALCSPGKAGL